MTDSVLKVADPKPGATPGTVCVVDIEGYIVAENIGLEDARKFIALWNVAYGGTQDLIETKDAGPIDAHEMRVLRTRMRMTQHDFGLAMGLHGSHAPKKRVSEMERGVRKIAPLRDRLMRTWRYFLDNEDLGYPPIFLD